ncbi:MAG: hypothetical protein HQL10_08870 [Nitrospirae bacterium]|nr:hypothetical protein [Nitrospirota bacterium]
MKLLSLTLALVFALVFSVQVFGEEQKSIEKSKAAKFEAHKAKALSHIDARIKLLQDDKTCIAAAKNQDDIKKCRQADHEKRKEMKESFKEEKKEHREKMKERKDK